MEKPSLGTEKPRLGPMRATELSGRLDHIDRQLSHVISLLHALVVDAAESDETLMRYQANEDGALEQKRLTGNGKG